MGRRTIGRTPYLCIHVCSIWSWRSFASVLFLLFLLSFQCVRSLRFENTVDSSVILGYTVDIDRLTCLQQSSHRTPITSRHHSGCRTFQKEMIHNDTSNMSSFFRFVTKRAIDWFGIISLAHAPVHVTDFPVVNVHVDELSSAGIWQHKLCATLSANVNINYRLPIKVYYRICTLRHIRIEIIHGSQNVFSVLTWVGGY
jgi:hypothetical protein